MFGPLGVPELLLIFALVLIVFGPRKLPEIGKQLGKFIGEFRKATDDLKNTIEREVRLEELKNIGPSMLTPIESVSRTEPVAAAESDTVTEPQPSEPSEPSNELPAAPVIDPPSPRTAE